MEASEDDATPAAAGGRLGFIPKVIVVAAITAAVGAVVTRYVDRALSGSHDPGPRFCTVRGIEEGPYLNAALTGRSSEVAGVAVWIRDESKWYFKPAEHRGQRWAVPGYDPEHPWEVGRHDPGSEPFTFAMLTRDDDAGGAEARVPGEDDGRSRIPGGFALASDQITLTKRELLHGGVDRRC